MEAEVEFRPAGPSDREEILDLMGATFGRGDRTKDACFWSWKHDCSPFGPSPVLVAEAENQLLALRTCLRWRWRVEGHEIRAVRAVDTVTRPVWQRKGLFRRLTLELLDRLSREGICFVFNTPNSRSLPGYLSMGWTQVARVPIWVRVKRPLTASLRLLRGGMYADEAPPPETSTRLGELFEQPALPSLLQAAAGDDRRFYTARSVEYLDWRYKQIPGIVYDARWEIRDEGAAAVIFRRNLRMGIRELRLAEVLVEPRRQSIRNAARLIEDAIAATRPDVVTGVAARATPEAAALRHAGLLPIPRIGPAFVVRTLQQPLHGPSPFHWPSWRCSLGDLEIL